MTLTNRRFLFATGILCLLFSLFLTTVGVQAQRDHLTDQETEAVRTNAGQKLSGLFLSDGQAEPASADRESTDVGGAGRLSMKSICLR